MTKFHNKMFLSLERLNIPSDLLDAIKAIYNNPTFQVTHKDKSSTWLPQRTGIRQGCPLSPYLFISTMHANYLELNLNRSKCCYIACNCQGQIRFQNGEPMKSSEETTYLGASVRQHIDPEHEIRKRISATMAILKKLVIFWIKTHCSKKWKLLVFNGNFGAHGSSWKAIKHVPTK